MPRPNPGTAEQRPIALTMGDPAGIGLEIAWAAWAMHRRRDVPRFALYGCPDAVRARAPTTGAAIAVIERIEDAAGLPPEQLPVLAIPAAARPVPGRPDPANAPAVIGAIERAVADVVAGHATAVVTNPISKETLYASGFEHPGHTEFLGALAARHAPGTTWAPVMMLAAPTLRVVPLTVHIPLARVPAAVTHAAICATVRTIAADLSRYFGIGRPRIWVTGLNPHAGEGGNIGREDVDVVRPAVVDLRGEGYDITGPLPADTMFHAAARARYDVALCMYHDQALIPLKTLAFDEGVNVTLGLPFVRTSPDHGTAFDIAGKGVASPASLVAALRLAGEMAGAAGRAVAAA